MTSTDQLKLTVRTPADLIAAVPYLLGFHPSDSVVVVATRRGKIIFAARGDLLPVGSSPAAQGSAAAHIAAVTARQAAEAATIIGYGPPERVTPAVDAVGAALGRTGIRILDALRVTDGRYWSYRCVNPRCCPAEGMPYDSSASEVAAAATFAGQVALPDRRALARQVAPVDGPARASMRAATDRAADRLDALLGAAPGENPADQAALREAGESTLRDAEEWAVRDAGECAVREAGESAVRQAVDRIRHRGALTDDEVAWLSLLLGHLPVRDYAWELITDDEWHVALWTEVLRRAEPDLVAAPASLLAFAAWRCGQGALASVAIERALACAPDYSMARLMDEVLRQGVTPSKLDGWPASGRTGTRAGRSGSAGSGRARRPPRERHRSGPRRRQGRRPGDLRY